MEILRACMSEIALSGLEGCTVTELWQHLMDHRPPLTLNLDRQTKEFIWRELKETVLGSSGNVGVYKLPGPRALKKRLNEYEGVCGIKLMKYQHPFPYRPISTDDGIRGSCTNFNERVEITKSVLRENLTLDDLSSTYEEDSVVLVASQEVRDRALFPEHKTTFHEMSLVQYCVLEVVGASRHNGILRTVLTKQYLKIDPRSTYHHCKMLESYGLLTITGSKRNSMELFHLLLLPHHPLPSWIAEVNYPAIISNLLLQSPDHTLPTSIVSSAIGKSYKASRDAMMRGGFIESVLLPRHPDTPVTKKRKTRASPASSGKVPKAWHLRLLKPFTAASDVAEKEEGGDGGERDAGGEREPLLFEVPLEMQGYRIIDRTGPQGINNSTFCDSTLAVDTLCARQVSKALIKSKKVVTILVDEDGIKKIKLVSSRNIGRNKEYERLRAEHARSSFPEDDIGIRTGHEMFSDPTDRYRDKKRQRRSESVVSSAGGTPSVGGASDNDEGDGVPVPECVPGPSGLDRENETTPTPPDTMILKSFRKGKQVLTYNQLKRLNTIMSYVEERGVVFGTSDIGEYLRQCEKSEGRSQVLDRKTAEKLILYLVQNKKLCQKSVSVPELPDLRLPHLYYTPAVDEERVATVLEKILVDARAAHVKREGRKRKRKRERDEEEEEEGGEEEEGEVEEEEDNGEEAEEKEEELGDDEMEVTPDVVRLSKYQRLKRLHIYLWILVHGVSETTPTPESRVAAAGTGGREEEEGGEGSGTRSLSTTSSFPWVDTVKQLPASGRGPGWLCYSDITPNMPLSLFSQLMPTLCVGLTIPARYMKYFTNPEHHNTQLYRLPRKLRSVVQSERRDVSMINQFLEKMVGLGLISIDGNIQINKRKDHILIHLEETHSILDTTVCVPRRSFFLEEARSLFKPITCTLTSLSSAEHYWYLLQSICLATPILLEAQRRKKKKKPPPSSTTDLHPLVYSITNMRSTSEIRKFNKCGFGAGGLPPLSFSHLPRNWVTNITTTTLVEDGAGGSMEWRPEQNGTETGGGIDWSYGPGMNLKVSATTTFGDNTGGVDQDGARDESRTQVELPANEEACLNPKPHPHGQVIHIPSQQIQRSSGGRGFTRFRTKKSVEVAKKLKKLKKGSSRYNVLVMDGASKKERMMVAMKPQRERARWLPHEDSFLLLAYLASHALRHMTGVAKVSYKQIRDVLHAKHQSSKDKSMEAVQRRIHKLRKRRKGLAETVNVCVAEIFNEIQGMGSSAPEPTFPSLLSFVAERYSSHGGLLLGKGSTLPNTLSQLHTGFQVVGCQTDGDVRTEEKGPVDKDHTPNHALIADLIIACLGAEEANYDNYAAFKIFAIFPEGDVQTAFGALKDRFLIRRKRQRLTVGVSRHSGPLQHQSFELATNFNSKLDFPYFHGTDQSAAEFAGNLAGKRSEVMNRLTSLSEDDTYSSRDLECGVEVDSSEVNGGIIASLISLLFSSNNDQNSAELLMPAKIFESDDEQTDQRQLEGDPDRGEEEEEGEERGGGRGGEEDEGRGVVEEGERGGEGRENEERKKTREGGQRRESRREEEEEDGEKEKAVHQKSQKQATTKEVVEEGDEEEEEEEEDEGEGEGEEKGETRSKDSRYTGTGLGSLLHINDTSFQNHGSLHLDLGLPVSSLLSPLPDEETTPSLARWAEKNASDLDTPTTPLSLDEYLILCRSHLKLSEADVRFNTEVYRMVEESGEKGVNEAELKDRKQRQLISSSQSSATSSSTTSSSTTTTSSSHLSHHLSISDHIQCLLNFEMILRVGSLDVRLVAAVHARRWCAPILGPDSKPTHDFVPYRPWITVNSTHPNETMMQRYRHGILTFIRANPGITMKHIADNFAGMLQFSSLYRVLLSLVSEKAISLHHLFKGERGRGGGGGGAGGRGGGGAGAGVRGRGGEGDGVGISSHREPSQEEQNSIFCLPAL